MNSFISGFQNLFAKTANGASTLHTSSDPLVDFFALAGAARKITEADIITLFGASYAMDKVKTLKLLFWARSCRGGAGERRLFRICLKYLKTNDASTLEKLLPIVAKFGRFDDLFETSIDFICSLYKDVAKGGTIENFQLLCKWTPRKGEVFEKIRKSLNLKPKELRKILVSNTKVVETQMCANEWEMVDFKSVPSYAMKNYKEAFARHSKDKFEHYISNVLNSTEKINSKVLFPSDLFQEYLSSSGDKLMLDTIKAQWNSLPNYLENSDKFNIIPVCDVSGSMTGLPMNVSVALGCYISERNKGIFKNAFITFSAEPKIQYLNGDIIQRFSQLQTAEWGMNTDLIKTIQGILNVGITNKVPESEMPNIILIISDMEFDIGANVEMTNYTQLVDLYSKSGYTIPKVVFWNVNGRIGNIPVSSKLPNTGLVSGFSPAILQSVLKCEDFTPRAILEDTISNSAYDIVEEMLSK